MSRDRHSRDKYEQQDNSNAKEGQAAGQYSSIKKLWVMKAWCLFGEPKKGGSINSFWLVLPRSLLGGGGGGASGVPRQHRGEIWTFLAEQYVLRQTVPSRPPAKQTPYKELLKQLTSQQHAILIDLGESPTHTHTHTRMHGRTDARTHVNHSSYSDQDEWN